MFFTAELNIGFWLVILWGLASWLFGSKQKKNQKMSGEDNISPRKSNNVFDLFKELEKKLEPKPEVIVHQQDEIENSRLNETEITETTTVESKEKSSDIFDHPIKYHEKIFEKEREIISDLDDSPDVHYIRKNRNNIQFSDLTEPKNKNGLKRVIVLTEILGKPKCKSSH